MEKPGYGAEIRKLADQYAAITGRMPFQGVEHRSRSRTRELYMFDGATFDNGPEALGHMTGLLREAREVASSAGNRA